RREPSMHVDGLPMKAWHDGSYGTQPSSVSSLRPSRYVQHRAQSDAAKSISDLVLSLMRSAVTMSDAVLDEHAGPRNGHDEGQECLTTMDGKADRVIAAWSIG